MGVSHKDVGTRQLHLGRDVERSNGRFGKLYEKK
jgi:hypothetical protein